MRPSLVIYLSCVLLAVSCGKGDGPSKSNNGNNGGVDGGTTGPSDAGLDGGGPTPDAGGGNNGIDAGPGTDSDNGLDDLGPGVDAGVDMAPNLCGNGVIDGGEQCDDGAANDDGGDGTCRQTCVPAACGDGTIDWSLREACDDGNTVVGDGCDDTCQKEVPPSCGDGAMDAGEECDLGARNSDHLPDACRSNCVSPTCGDAVADSGEECDDGNVRDGDGCSSSCSIEAGPSCGDGSRDIAAGEECDDGNNAAGDGCSASCQLEPVGALCGNSSVEAGEVCDDGNAFNGDGCNPTCNLMGDVTTPMPRRVTGVSGAGGMAVDMDRLWLADNNGFQIGYVGIDACLNRNNCGFTAVAGNGNRGYRDDATGSNAQVGFVEAMATDGNTVWFFDNGSLRAFSTTPPHAVTTVAGDPTVTDHCDVVDGIGSAARFHGTRGLTYYNGILYFLDGCTGVLRQFDPSNNEVRTIAGTQWQPSNPAPPQCPSGNNFRCNAGSPADGFGTAGAMVSPRYMASDNAGMLYIVDTNGQTLRTYNTVTGWLGTLAGGTQGYVDDFGTAARLSRPRGLTSDGTSLYWSEQTEHTVRQVEIGTAETSTLAGQRGCSGTRDGLGGNNQQVLTCVIGSTPHFDTPFNIDFHYPSNSLFVRDANGVRRIE